jgi:nitronate monooxygenase
MWPNRRFLDLVGIEHPIIQAPMAGSSGSALAIATSDAGGLGSLPCGMLNVDQVCAELNLIRQQTGKPVNANFFCHANPVPDAAREAAWRERLAPYYVEFGLDPKAAAAAPVRAPFDATMCDLVVEQKPRVVSFHYGLPAQPLLRRLTDVGCVIIGCATTPEEARWLEAHGADAVIAQGLDAGGHRGMFLTEDLATQAGTFTLVPQVVDAVAVPVIAAGGVGDARGVAAALALGASAVQMGTAYLFCPEARIAPPYRAALADARDQTTAMTNVVSGRPARGFANRLIREVGPMSPLAPPFPLATGAVAPLRAAAEAKGSGDFSPMWAGQAAALGRAMGAGELTHTLAQDALDRLRALVERPTAG